MLTQEQIEMRMSGVGGSDMPIIAGLDKSRATLLELYHVKRGEIDGDEVYKRVNGSSTDLADLGNGIEPVLAAWYEKNTGFKTFNRSATLRHKDLDWMLGNVDRLVYGGKRRNKRTGAAGDRRGLEFKMRVSGEGWGPNGSSEIPHDVMVQCQSYLEITDRDLWDVVVLIGGCDIRRYTVERDSSLIHKLIDCGGEFWDMVQTGTPPDFDFEHRTANKLLDVLYPGTNGKVVKLPHEAFHFHQVIVAARELRSEQDKLVQGAKAWIRHHMGEASIGLLPDGSAYKRAERTKREHVVPASNYTTLEHIRSPEVT